MKIKDEVMSDLRTAFIQRRKDRAEALLKKPKIMVKHPRTGETMTKEAYQKSLEPKIYENT